VVESRKPPAPKVNMTIRSLVVRLVSAQRIKVPPTNRTDEDAYEDPLI